MTTPPDPADHRRSLADLAQRDLDAALQLLAERAQYITAASGAAIALRRGEHNDMLCRASAGANAPELGAILSMEYGLSGESVRTRQVLRCDDVASDPRVNREACLRLGIASVVVMPIVSDDQALGVFELLSGEPRAFEERDLSALRRLSEMVEIAIRHAVIAQPIPPAPEVQLAEPQVQEAVQAVQETALEPQPSESVSVAAVEQAAPSNESADETPTPAEPEAASAPQEFKASAPEEIESIEIESTAASAQKSESEEKPPEAPPKKPLFWSAASQPDVARTPGESTRVPPGLRNLQKCQACGFPVSPGRTFCVECEEKQWRGQPLLQPAARPALPAPAKTGPETIAHSDHDSAPNVSTDVASVQNTLSMKDAATPAHTSIVTAQPAENSNPQLVPSKSSAASTTPVPSVSSSSAITSSTPRHGTNPLSNSAGEASLPEPSTLFLSSTSSESWLASNKYILIALVAVAIIIAALAFLR